MSALRLWAKDELSAAAQSIACKRITLIAIARNAAILRMSPPPGPNMDDSIKGGIQNPELQLRARIDAVPPILKRCDAKLQGMWKGLPIIS
jgi:hypothetical protein